MSDRLQRNASKPGLAERRHAILWCVASIGVGVSALLAPRSAALYCESLRQLHDGDCPTPRCTREARGTGMARRDDRFERWFVEFRCPRCGEVFSRSTDELHALVERLEREGGCEARGAQARACSIRTRRAR
jgi:hypothetical protein